jgi:hypothetical protein
MAQPDGPEPNPFDATLVDVLPDHAFPTRFGHCLVTSTTIIIVNDSPRGTLSRIVSGTGMRRLVITRVVTAVVFAGMAIYNQSPIYALAAGYFLFAVVYTARTNLTRDMEISRDVVTEVEVVAGRPGLSVPRLVVHYTIDGVAARRMIQLPGVFFGRAGALERANAVLRQTGLLS